MRRRASRAVLAATLLTCLLSSPAAAELAVDAGALRAKVRPDPWRLELVGPRGRNVLAEHRGTGPGPLGTLGFRTDLGWSHATRIAESRRQGDAFVAELETTDPARTIEVTLRPAANGVIALDASVRGSAVGLEAVGIGFAAVRGERYFGFGERSNAVDQRGGVVESYVADGPYQDEEYPFLQPFVPNWGLRDGRPEATYFPIPWLVSSAGYGVLVENPETTYHRLDADGGWSVEVVAAPADELTGLGASPPTELSLRFFAGPDPLDALRRFSAYQGRQPRPAAPWLYGPWYQADDEEEAELELLRREDAPVSVLQTYLHYLPCGDQRGREAEQPGRTRAAHRAGVAITTYFNPMICAGYDPPFSEAAASGALTRTRSGDPYLYRYGTEVTPDENFQVGQFDFFRPAAAAQYERLLREAMRHGYDGWMEDFGEYTPLDSVSGDGIHGTRAHNPYPTRYHCAAYEAVRRERPAVIRFQRSGWTGAARCAQVVWGGDPTTAWGFDGLRSALTQALSAGLSGISVWGSAIGGYFMLGSNELTPEMLIRWVQLGAVSGVMRTEANGVGVPPKSRPQAIDDDQLANWRRYSKLRTQLYPYLVAAQRQYRRTGVPLMRHLALVSPGDPQAIAREDEFMFGDDLLAAPVLDPDVRERDVYLPGGRWVDLWRALAYRERTGGLRVVGAEPLRGRRVVTIPAPLDELPLLARAGAVLPLLPPETDTLSDYGPDRLVSLAESRRALELIAFPRGRSGARLYGRGRIASVERRRSWVLRVRRTPARRYHLQAALEATRRSLEPCEVALDGRRLPGRRWSYDAAAKVLEAEFSGRSPRLVASARGCR